MLGALTLSFAQEQSFDKAAQDFITTLADTCSHALSRALLFEKTHRSEERFRGLFENTLDAILMADPSGRIVAANKSATELFGYDESEFAALSVPDLFDESELPRLTNEKDRQRSEHYGEWKLKHKNGQLIFAEMSCPSFPDGHSQAVIRDISARKRAELEREKLTRELETETTILDSILKNAPIGFTFLTPELRYAKTNEALADINGVSAEAHLERTVADIVPDLAPKVSQGFKQVLENGESLSLELSGETAKHPGVRRYWAEHIYRVQNSKNETLGLGVLVQEITERKRRELSNQFLLDLTATTRYLSKADDIEYSVIKSLGDYLGASNCTFADIKDGQLFITQQWNERGASDLTGNYALADFAL